MNTHHGVALYFSSMKCIRLWARTRVALYHRQTEQKKSNLRKISVNAVEQTAAAISVATIAAHLEAITASSYVRFGRHPWPQ